MRRFSLFIIALAPIFAASAQAGEPKATGSVWLDTFAGPNGAVIYPQYTWTVLPTSVGAFGGYGFLESAPRELLFNNNLVNFTPAKAQWFTAHGEIGCLPGKRLGFVQLGPRLNFQKAVPGLGKVMAFAWGAYLPELKGIRTRNFVIAGATKQFPIAGQQLTAHLEAFNRTFVTFSYGEVWLVGQVRGYKRIEPVAHVIRDSSAHPKYTVAGGVRIHLFN